MRYLQSHPVARRGYRDPDDAPAGPHRLAVAGALDKVGALVLQSHLKRHVVTARERGDEDRIVEELLELLKYR